MTIEEKATAYDKALEKARNFELPEYQRVMKELFPELRMTKYIDKGKELTRKDIEIILGIENNILHECNDNSQLVIEAYPKGEDYYGEILRRFNNQRIKPQRMVSAEAKEALYDKPAWSEEDERILEEVKFNFESNKEQMTPALMECYEKFFNKIKHLIPQNDKQELSGEDETAIDVLINLVKMPYGNYIDFSAKNRLLNWLIALKGRITQCRE